MCLMTKRNVSVVRSDCEGLFDALFSHGLSIELNWNLRKGVFTTQTNQGVVFAVLVSHLKRRAMTFIKNSEKAVGGIVRRHVKEHRDSPENAVLQLKIFAVRTGGLMAAVSLYANNSQREEDGRLVPLSSTFIPLATDSITIGHFDLFPERSVRSWLEEKEFVYLCQPTPKKPCSESTDDAEPIPKSVSHEVNIQQYLN